MIVRLSVGHCFHHSRIGEKGSPGRQMTSSKLLGNEKKNIMENTGHLGRPIYVATIKVFFSWKFAFFSENDCFFFLVSKQFKYICICNVSTDTSAFFRLTNVYYFFGENL